MVCQCGAVIMDGAKFCGRCGRPVSEVAQPVVGDDAAQEFAPDNAAAFAPGWDWNAGASPQPMYTPQAQNLNPAAGQTYGQARFYAQAAGQSAQNTGTPQAASWGAAPAGDYAGQSAQNAPVDENWEKPSFMSKVKDTLSRIGVKKLLAFGAMGLGLILAVVGLIVMFSGGSRAVQVHADTSAIMEAPTEDGVTVADVSLPSGSFSSIIGKVPGAVSGVVDEVASAVPGDVGKVIGEITDSVGIVSDSALSAIGVNEGGASGGGSVAGIILLIVGVLLLIGGGVLLFLDMRKQKKSAIISTPDAVVQ